MCVRAHSRILVLETNLWIVLNPDIITETWYLTPANKIYLQIATIESTYQISRFYM
jgi:hypothetical protein